MKKNILKITKRDVLHIALVGVFLSFLIGMFILAPTTKLNVAKAQTSDPVIAAVGDIACQSGFSGSATSYTCKFNKVSDLLTTINPVAFLALGDLVYDEGELTVFNQWYTPTFGRFNNITYPIPGNHEYLTTNAAGYYDYFEANIGVGNRTTRPGARGEGYYTYNIGNWKIIALNTGQSGSFTATTPMVQWFTQELQNSPTCTLVYMHHPVFTSDIRPGRDYSSSRAKYGYLFQLMYQNKVDLLLVGHDHHYQRFKPQDANAQVDLQWGVPQFTIGTGGKDHFWSYDHDSNSATPKLEFQPAPNSALFEHSTYGIMKFTLKSDRADYEFVPYTGSIEPLPDGTVPPPLQDTGSVVCDGPDVEGTTTGGITPGPTATPGPSATPTVTPTPGTSVILNPTADSTADGTDTTTSGNNYGGSTSLTVDGDTPKVVYMKFDLTPYTGRTVASASLKLRVTNASNVAQSLKLVTDNSWQENIINYNNRPALTTVLGTVNGGLVGADVTFDVTQAINSNVGQIITLGIDQSGADGVVYSSRESATNKPELSINFATGPTNTPTPTPIQCTTTLPTGTGSVDAILDIPQDGTYKVWSRILAPDTSNTAYWLQVGSNCPIKVGGSSSITPLAWNWINYNDGNTSNSITMALTAGQYPIKLVGATDGIGAGVDRIIFTKDLACVPTGTGDNCIIAPTATPTVPPTPTVTPTPAATTTPATTLGFSSTAGPFTQGTTFPSSVTINSNGNSITNVDLVIKFDPAILQAEDITVGSFLTNTTTIARTLDNVNGKILFSFYTSTANAKTGVGTLANITWRAQGAGSSEVSFENGTTIVYGQGGNNVISQANTTTHTVTAAATPTPSPTVCPLPTAPTVTAPATTIVAGLTDITWTTIAGATKYNVRIDDKTNAWAGTCTTLNAGDSCINNVTGTSTPFDFQPGRQYTIWVHAVNTCGLGAASANRTITVAAPTATPTPTPTSTPTPTNTPTPTVTPTPTTPAVPTPTNTPTPTIIPTPTPIPCAITSASWSSPNPVNEGIQVGLNATTSGDCSGQQVAFEIREDDGLVGFDAVSSNPVNSSITGNSATSTWVAEYQLDGNGLAGTPEYFFVAKLISNSIEVRSSDPLLVVNKLQGRIRTYFASQGGAYSSSTANIQLYDSSDRLLKGISSTPITVDGQRYDSIEFDSVIDIGTYKLHLKKHGYLNKIYPLTVTDVSNIIFDLRSQPLLGGDINDDNIINAIDIGQAVDEYSPLTSTTAASDINGDSRVNAIDIGLVIENYFKSGE